MTQLSPSDAAVEGFRVIGAHWRLVAGWAFFNLLGIIVLGVAAAIVALGASANPDETSASVGGLLGFLGTLAIFVVVVTALYRLMLRPAETGYLRLRAGPDELRMLGVWLIYIAGAVVFLGLAVLVGRLAYAAAPWLTGPVGLLAIAVAVWLSLRFCLAGPISFAERRVGFGASWRATRGQAWALFGMAVLVGCFVLLILILGVVIFFLAAVAILGLREAMSALASPQSAEAHPALYLLQLIGDLLLSAAVLVIVHAPLVAAHRTLRGETAAG